MGLRVARRHGFWHLAGSEAGERADFLAAAAADAAGIIPTLGISDFPLA